MRSNARITRTPLRPSSSMRLSLSNFDCMTLKSGIATRMIKMISTSRIGMTMSNTNVRTASWPKARIRPPMIIRGALIIMFKMMIKTCCTWVVSLVVRVMSDAVLTLSNSCNEKLPTRVNSLPRIRRPKPMATLAE